MNLPAGPQKPLPTSILEIADTLGTAIALRLMQEFGGLEIKLPLKPAADHEIIQVFGEQDGLALCQYLGGQLFYVPHGRIRRTARAEIQALEAAGKDRGQIARILGISQRHVRRAANSPDPDRRQGKLFDDI